MISQWIIKKLAGPNPDYKNIITRTRLGSGAGLVGILLNLALTLTKAAIGYISGSISIVADAFNNLTDTASSVVSLVGIRLSGKARDEEHPYGHGRGEYIATLIVAFVILFVGLSLLKSSFEGIINTKKLTFTWPSFIIIILSIFVKLWMYLFYQNVGEKISSSPLMAASLDSLGDVLVTSVVAFSYVLSRFIDFPVDGVGGIFVSLFILKSGYDLISETISDIIGVGPSNEFKKEIGEIFKDRKEILSTHYFQVYDYGQGSKFGTIDAVVGEDANIVEIHDIFTEIEHEVLEKYGVLLTIHMDLMCGGGAKDKELTRLLDSYLKENENILSYHDQAVICKGQEKHIMVHILADGNKITTNQDEKREIEKLSAYLYQSFGNVDFDIVLDKNY